MGTRKVKVTDYLGRSLSELTDYRTHLVPVKKYSPRMFMGKEVPYGATHYLINEDDKYIWLAYLDRGNHNPAFYQSGSWYTLPLDAVVRGPIHKLPKQENIMKEFSKEDLKSGMKVILRNGQSRTVFKDTLDEGTVIVANSGSWSKLDEYDENFCFEDRGLCELDIDIIYTVHTYEMLCNTGIFDAKEILWKREAKTQEQVAYEALQAQIAEEEARHADSIKALREQAEKLKPKVSL